jgi:hypothetical protein
MKKTMLMVLMLGVIAASMMAVLESSTIATTFASSGSDPRDETACDNVVRLEGEQNERTEPPDNTFHGHDMPDAQGHGADQAREGAEKATGDCLD